MIRISPLEAEALLARNAPPKLLDVREEDEYALCRITGSILAPLSRFAEIYQTVLPYLNEPVILHCHHGVRSARAAQFLEGKGYTEVYNMEGGIEGWSREVDASVPRY